jgi:thioesterase domain-containing protein
MVSGGRVRIEVDDLFFRAKARALLSGSSLDLGWGRFVDMLKMRQTNGRHGSILHPPHVGELARQLGELLDDLGS